MFLLVHSLLYSSMDNSILILWHAHGNGSKLPNWSCSANYKLPAVYHQWNIIFDTSQFTQLTDFSSFAVKFTNTILCVCIIHFSDSTFNNGPTAVGKRPKELSPKLATVTPTMDPLILNGQTPGNAICFRQFSSNCNSSWLWVHCRNDCGNI